MRKQQHTPTNLLGSEVKCNIFFTILFFNGVFFPYMLLTEQVKAKMKYYVSLNLSMEIQTVKFSV